MSDADIPETVPAEYGGKWIAWSSDALRIIGVGDSAEEAEAAAARAGETESVVEWVPPADEL